MICACGGGMSGPSFSASTALENALEGRALLVPVPGLRFVSLYTDIMGGAAATVCGVAALCARRRRYSSHIMRMARLATTTPMTTITMMNAVECTARSRRARVAACVTSAIVYSTTYRSKHTWATISARMRVYKRGDGVRASFLTYSEAYNLRPHSKPGRTCICGNYVSYRKQRIYAPHDFHK